MRFKTLTILMAAAVLSACATSPNPEAEKQAKAWRAINAFTDITDVGGNRLRVMANTPFASGGDELEKAALMRAAGEAARRGYPRFAIVYVDYRERGPASWLSPDLGDPTARWIGSYEDLLAARDRADLDGSLDGPFGFKRLEAVVLMLGPDEEPYREAFTTNEVYAALTQDRIERNNIQASRHLKLPSLRVPFRGGKDGGE